MEITSDNITTVTKEQMVEQYINLGYSIEEMESARAIIKEELLLRMEYDSEIVGGYTVTKVKRYKFEVDLAKAKELGATKLVVDDAMLKKLLLKGVEVPHNITVYPLIKEVKPSDE